MDYCWSENSFEVGLLLWFSLMIVIEFLGERLSAKNGSLLLYFEYEGLFSLIQGYEGPAYASFEKLF